MGCAWIVEQRRTDRTGHTRVSRAVVLSVSSAGIVALLGCVGVEVTLGLLGNLERVLTFVFGGHCVWYVMNCSNLREERYGCRRLQGIVFVEESTELTIFDDAGMYEATS